MCGICGVIGENDGSALQSMLRRLIHRGPDEGESIVNLESRLVREDFG